MLFAHHLEGHHYPILTCFLIAGFWIGWNLMTRFVTRKDEKSRST